MLGASKYKLAIKIRKKGKGQRVMMRDEANKIRQQEAGLGR